MKELQIPEGTNLIINDTRIPDEQVITCFSEATSKPNVKFKVISAYELSQEVNEIWKQSTNSNTAILLPGEGAKIFSQFIPLNPANCFEIATRRQFQNNRPGEVSVKIPADLGQFITNGEISEIVICDDVIASGSTIQTIRKKINYEFGQTDYSDYRQGDRFSFPTYYPPKIKWSATTWLTQRTADTTGFNINTALQYSRRSGRVPVNSLSTFLASSEKAKAVKESYGNKYFTEKTVLFELINLLKNYE